jgi:hypothetical protein
MRALATVCARRWHGRVEVAVMRDAGARLSRDGGPSAIGRQGTVERVGGCGDRATALIVDIWCEKIRGCSYTFA